MLNEEKLNELCAKELLELDRHTYGYATAGKDINAVLDRYSIAYKSGYRAAESDAQELMEGLRKVIIWAECVSMKIEDRERINWTYLNDGREVLSKWRERGV